MATQEPFPTITNDQQSKLDGFSHEQIAALFKVKALYQQGTYHEANPEHKRLEFVRWLYLHGRLES